MALGLGGIWVEALRDTALRLLPITRADVIEMLLSLRGIKLLQGFRGAPAADLEAIAAAVVQIGQAALSLGSDLAALEINPLRVCGSQVEALDALAIWKDETTCPGGLGSIPSCKRWPISFRALKYRRRRWVRCAN